jgi:hypothetical protein
MGFFSSIKDNLTRGGVDVTIEAPENLLISGAPITIKITIVNKKTEFRLVKKITVKLTETETSSSYNSSDDMDHRTTYTLFEVENNNSFQLNGSETKVLYLDLSTQLQVSDTDENPFTDTVAKIVKALDNSRSVNCHIKAIVDVEGIAIDPSDSQAVSLDKASKFNVNSNWH